MTIFLISAPSGAGKNTIVNKVEEMGLWSECISVTTRSMRDGEIDGVTYNYMRESEFLNLKANGKLIEDVEYDGNFYGITEEDFERAFKRNKNVVIIVEYGGYLQIKEKYPDAVGIFLHMSKEECMANMLIRGDSVKRANRRIEKYDEEFEKRVNYDYVIKNVRNKQEETAEIVKNIIMQYKR